MLSRGDLTDEEWAVLEPLLPKSNNRCGRWRDDLAVSRGHHDVRRLHGPPVVAVVRPPGVRHECCLLDAQ